MTGIRPNLSFSSIDSVKQHFGSFHTHVGLPTERLASAWWKTGINALVSALLAPSCAVCDTVLDDVCGGCVCERCWRSLVRIVPPVCDRCGDPLARPGTPCATCAYRSNVVDRSRAVGEYDGVLRDVVHALKYQGRRSLAAKLAKLMARSGEGILSSAHFVVPVPLHWRREQQRGFNQARLLAQHLNIPVIEPLARITATRPQVELSADRRLHNVRGAFRLRRWPAAARDVGGMKLILVDDVATTGATLDECTRILKEAGAAEVCALTAARVTRVKAAQAPVPQSGRPIPRAVPGHKTRAFPR